MSLLIILMFSLYQLVLNKVEDRIVTEKERDLHQLQKSDLKNWGNVKIFELLKPRLKWSLKFIAKAYLIKWIRICFHSSSYNDMISCDNHFIRDHCRLVIPEFLSTFSRLSSLKELYRILSLILGLNLI